MSKIFALIALSYTDDWTQIRRVRMKDNQIAPKKSCNPPSTKRIVGSSRGEFGTRISRKVVCEKCQKVDYVSVSFAKKNTRLFCSLCAESEIGAVEFGRAMKPDLIDCKCSQCKKNFQFPQHLKKRGPLLCADCHQGFEIWSGSLAKSPKERESGVISRRPAGTVLRTRT